MDSGASTTLRWSRAVLLAGVVVSSGTVAHVTASGLLPGPAFFVVVAAITVLFGATALARPASVRRVVLLTVAGQTWIHLALTAAAGHRGDPVVRHAATPAPALPAAPAGRPQTYLDVYEASRPATSGGSVVLPSPLLHLAAEMSDAQAPMMLLHLVAAAVVGLWLAQGERALWALLAALLGAHAVFQLPTLAVSCRPLPARDDLPARPRPRLVSRPVLRRGPPTLLAV